MEIQSIVSEYYQEPWPVRWQRLTGVKPDVELVEERNTNYYRSTYWFKDENGVPQPTTVMAKKNPNVKKQRKGLTDGTTKKSDGQSEATV